MIVESTQPSRLALAWAERDLKEEELIDPVVKTALGRQSMPTSVGDRESYIAWDAELIEKVLFANSFGVARSIVGSGLYCRLADEVQEPLVQILKDAGIFQGLDLQQIAQANCRSFAEDLADRFLPDHLNQMTADIFKLAYRSRELSQEMGVAHEDVFETDGHYKLLMQRTYTPFDLAMDGLSVKEDFDPRAFGEVMFNLCQNIADTCPVDIEAFKFLTFDQKDKKRMIDGFNNPLVKQACSELIKPTIVLNRVTAVEKIKRFWGEEGLHSLPQDMRRKLLSTEQ